MFSSRHLQFKPLHRPIPAKKTLSTVTSTNVKRFVFRLPENKVVPLHLDNTGEPLGTKVVEALGTLRAHISNIKIPLQFDFKQKQQRTKNSEVKSIPVEAALATTEVTEALPVEPLAPTEIPLQVIPQEPVASESGEESLSSLLPQQERLPQEEVVIPLEPVSKKSTQSSLSFPQFIKEGAKFMAVSAGTFVIVLTVMNFSAYYQVANYWFNTWQGNDNLQTKHLEALVDSPEKKLQLLQPNDGGIPFLPKAGSSGPAVSLDVLPPDNRIVIPKIGKNVPIVDIPDANLIAQNWEKLEEDIQVGLKNGVVHYPGTAVPGQKGNFFVTGHSSYYFWEHSKYKDVFALLPELEVGDDVTVYYNQKQYTYRINEKKIVKPTDTDVLKQTDDNRITLMTCWPVGTDLNRMIFVGEEIAS